MSPPTDRFSKLSIESMPPTTRSQSRMSEYHSSTEPDSDSEFEVDEENGEVTFPSNLSYSLNNLDRGTRERIFKALSTHSKIVLQQCQSRDQDCIFEVSELVEHTVRIGSDNSRYSVPSCTCEQSERGDGPCRHVLWLCDQITNQIVNDREHVLTMRREGYPTEIGNLYDEISTCHLDTLADSLHCDVVGQSADPNPRRVQAAREILASLSRTHVDEYRPDIFNEPTKGTGVTKKGDIEQTVFRMLLKNNEMFQYFLSSIRPSGPFNNYFRRLQHRADAAIAGFDEWASAPTQRTTTGPKDVGWCVSHLDWVLHQISRAIYNAPKELQDWERRAAARTLARILRQVVERNEDHGPKDARKADRNLYFRLVGDQDRNYVVRHLNALTPLGIRDEVDNLDETEGLMLRHGAPPSYVDRLRDLISRVRHLSGRSSLAAGSKRTGQGQDPSPKRMK